MRRWHWILVVYLVLLAASHAVRWLKPEAPAAELAVEVPAFAGDEQLESGRVRLTYRAWGADDEDRPVVLLVHGSPGAASNFQALGPVLGERYRVIAPDLPGFGEATRDVPDYSIRAHARYLLAFLDTLGIAQVHAVGFSMGGGVVLHLWELEPERVESLTLLSAIGVQDLELFGQYHLNHGVHGAQLFGLWLLHEAVPHFGALDGSMLSVAYARNFWDTDQRPLRGLLERYGGPMLILHGENDILVPFEAAQEHHRIVPQSQLVAFDANHFLVFRRPQLLADPLERFVDAAETGQAPTRADAPPARLEAAKGERYRLGKLSGFALAVSMILIALATLVTEDLTCIAVGLLVAQGRIDFVPGAVACFLGIVLGDLLLFLAGRWLGRPWFERAPLKWVVSSSDLEKSARWFERRGALVVFMSRFIPGTRLPTYVAAGVLRLGFLKFLTYLILPAAIWTPLLVALSRALGRQVFDAFEVFSRYAVVGLAAAILVVWLAITLLEKLLTHQGRRELWGWWLRKVKWEFWPPWVFYPPVVAYVLWLGVRFRSLTLFTLSNPSIPAGGFIGESKSEILGGLDPGVVARYRSISGQLAIAKKVAEVRTFLEQEDLTYPVVLKPDAGERGSGVKIVRAELEAEEYFRRQPGPVIVQEYVAGAELGIFWVRRPGEERGQIFSITDKRLPEVEGDGEHSLRRLILDDPRAVAMAGAYAEALGDRLDEVPAAGERVKLVEVGTHCRGAIFLDGEKYKTPELERVVEEIGRSFEGFYFGRFDIRAPTYEAFREGRSLKVLELNGVTSEATHIYDPKNSLLEAYRILFRQWRLAFEIGAKNRERGHEPDSLGDLITLLRDFRRRARSS